MRTWWWLRRHRRHGTGPVLHQREARALDPDGQARGPLMVVTWYRCECGAVHTVTKVPA